MREDRLHLNRVVNEVHLRPLSFSQKTKFVEDTLVIKDRKFLTDRRPSYHKLSER